MAEERQEEPTGPDTKPAPGSLLERARAWSVHVLTASGAVVGVLALLEAAGGDLHVSALWMLVALAIDGVDGSLARRWQVKRHAPAIDGRRLDDVVDFLNYVVVPVCFLWWGGYMEHWAVAAAPVMASAYGFSQADAKTEDHFFLGFPSYWNVVAIYVWAFDWSVGATAALLLVLAAAVFVPLKYVYPSQMRRLWWTTNLGAALWVVVMAAIIRYPELFVGTPWLAATLLYPAWYVLLSLVMGGLARRSARAG